MTARRASTKGFKRTSALLQNRIRVASEQRGFAQSRLLTDWTEIAGEQVSQMSRPVEISYGRGGMGATLTLLTTGSNAPILEMQKEQIRQRVNSVYGYHAIARVRITQTAATGFAEGQVAFAAAPKANTHDTINPKVKELAQAAAKPVEDAGLREALARLGENVLNKTNR